MLKKIALAVVVVLVVLLGVIATRPDTFEVKRSLVINASPEDAFELVNDFHGWSLWSPWDHLDPHQVRTFSGSQAGSGSVYHWKGNKDVGEGEMRITQSTAGQHISIALEFIEPFPAKNDTNFDFAKTGDGTTVTWSMSGANNFMSKAMSLFMSMDKMVGGDFERGLASLKTEAEKRAAARRAEAQKAAEAAPAAPPESADAGQ